MKPADVYIINQPEPYRSILLHLVAVLEMTLETSYRLECKWTVPYMYYKGRPFCFLNASHKGQFVDLGFSRGFKLLQHQELLVSEGRNTMKSLRYQSLEGIDPIVLTDLIQEAMALYP
ncbi:DUF1801 domain-containing protein [Flavobacterium sp. WV_118_3]|uniref:DUF1801 domain-containing protein n=1 Tax=Flavobacterium sp. WV_118_3 TaxID=3151764 RepID=UPI00321BE007